MSSTMIRPDSDLDLVTGLLDDGVTIAWWRGAQDVLSCHLKIGQARALRDALLAHFPIESDQSQPEPAGAATEAGA